MVETLAAYHLLRGDLPALEHFSEECARVLGKRGSDGFPSSCSEARYFLLAIEYHLANLKANYEAVRRTDAKIARKLSRGKEVFYGESWRRDVMATVFEFDAELVCVRALFDRLVQVMQTPLNLQLPNSIRDFVKQSRNDSLSQELKTAWEEWGAKSADYRDCLMHNWTLHTNLEGFFTKTMSRKLLIPDNPEQMSKKKFTFHNQIQLIDYASLVHERSEALVTSVFQNMFERLIREEFGAKAQFTYWDKLPEIDLQKTKPTGKLLISPALVCDSGGRKMRIPRYVRVHDGKVVREDMVLSKEFVKELTAPFTLEDNPVYQIEMHGAIANGTG